ncbi:MAG: nuclear transport factor 2 family protein [Nitrospirae bacterium]|nr:nuclear transport factor 2 family protein [Nitrospirota bacterium]
MVDKRFALDFAEDWVASWNSHDLNRILSHYDDNFEMSSPKIITIAGEPSGALKGKKKVGAYWAKALQLFPDLRFELISTLVGVNSVTIYYKGARARLAAEVFHFGSDNKVIRAFAHYAD